MFFFFFFLDLEENSKNLHRHKEKIKHSNIQWVKDCSPFPQQGQKI